jgi:hypothetical protein
MRGESEGKTWTMVVTHAFYSHRGEVEWGVGSSNERHTGRGRDVSWCGASAVGRQ